MKSIVAYNPGSVLSAFDEMDRLVGDFFGSSPLVRGFSPAVDIREDEDRYVFEAELPGLGEKDVELKLANSVLTVASAKSEKSERGEGGYLLRERRSAAFKRSFSLPRDVDVEKVEASFSNGLLVIILPKRPEAREKTIAIKSA